MRDDTRAALDSLRRQALTWSTTDGAHALGEMRRIEELYRGRTRTAEPDLPPALLTAEQVAARLGMSKQWVYDNQCDLGAVRPLDGRAVRFPEHEIAAHEVRRQP